MPRAVLPLLLAPLALLLPAPAQNFAPPAPLQPTEEQLQPVRTMMRKLEARLSSLKRQGVRDPNLADLEIYLKAAEWTVRHGEFYTDKSLDWTVEALERGLQRASQQASGDTPWLETAGATIVRGYRSLIDGSVQPYAVTLPADYGKIEGKRYRLDVVLHGRSPTLTEVSFLHQHNGDRPPPKGLDHVRIDIYGRGNNAYRWAGEMDVQEAVQNFLNVERLRGGRDLRIDNARVVLRGFSMGGAGTWHLGLHKPDRWAVLGPGAGFTTTRGYLKDLPAQLPDYVSKCLHIYDAVDYAENVFNVPVVAFSGSEDPQMQAAVNIEKRLKDLPGLDLKITHLIAPGLGHQFPPEWQAKAEKEYAVHVAKGRPEYPTRVRFVTWTLKYHICDWVELLGLDNHYEKAVVDAQFLKNDGKYKITTTNIRGLHVGLYPGDPTEKYQVEIDGQSLEAMPYHTPTGDGHIYLMKGKNGWESVFPQKIIADVLRRPQKVNGLTGPIDDAFMGPFVCVRGTGTPWNQAVHDHAEANLKRFEAEWDKYMRGKLPVVTDVEVLRKPEEGVPKHLILFGDPGSNRLIGQNLDRLPLEWTKETVKLGGMKVPAANHVPVLIHPSPINVERYVVLNSGHTFRGEDFRGTNALLYPRLGDYAVLELTDPGKTPLATKVVGAGLFDDFWRVKQ